MDLFIKYILVSTLCLSVFYLGYLIFLRKELRLCHLRYFLLLSMLLAIIMPLSNFKISYDFSVPGLIKRQRVIDVRDPLNEIISETNNYSIQDVQLSTKKMELKLKEILLPIYFIGLVLFLLRLAIQLIIILKLSADSIKTRQGNITLLINKKIKSPFSFFHLVFVPTNLTECNDTSEIITHERIHASQYHSIDLILIELLSAVMWFNPLIWMMRKSVQSVHEYLADEGVLSTGVDRLKYQALLINQVAEERFICLSSNFNHSLIKKRLIMMTKSKFNQHSKLSVLTLIPIALFLFIGVACIKGQEVNNTSRVFTILIDAGHGGNDPGVKVNDKIAEKDLTLSIAKILKEKASSYKNLNLIFTREEDEFIELNKRTEFQADLCISIHVNSDSNLEVSGITCFSASDSKYKDKSLKIGSLILSKLNQISGIQTQNAVKEANFKILKDSKGPALLLSLGYLSNPNDLSFITDENNQDLICDKILDVISQLD